MKSALRCSIVNASRLSLGIALAAMVIPPFAAHAAGVSDAEVLLRLLQDKGLITAEEIEAARSELAVVPEAASEVAREPAPSVIQTAKWIERIDLYGDARLRFETRSGKDGATPGDDRMERHRWRYRLRGGANMDFTDAFRAGIRLETGPGGRSTNATFGDDDGPWGKSKDGIHVGLLFLNWTPTEWFSTTAGRQPIPFRVTSMVWDSDLCPEGMSQSFTFKVGDAELFATFGQFIYDDANPDNPFGSGSSFHDAFLFVNQAGTRYHFTKQVSAQIAPVIHIYSGQGDSYRGPFIGTNMANTTGINDLLVLAIPMEVRFPLGSLPARIFGDYAVNFKGKDRARAAGTPAADDQIHAWQAGLEIGSSSKKGGWRTRAFYQSTGLYSLDPNMVDSDLFDSRVNMKGYFLQATYAFTDFLTCSLTYANADRKDKSLPTGAAGDIGGNAGTAYLEDYQLFQADLNFRF